MSIWSDIGAVAKRAVSAIPVIGGIVNGPQQIDPGAALAAQGQAATDRAASVADQASAQLAAAQTRHSDPGNVDATTAAPVQVGPATVNTAPTVGVSGTAAAPDIATVAPVTAATVATPGSVANLGDAVRGTTDAAQVGPVQVVDPSAGRNLQNASASYMEGVLNGTIASPAELQLKQGEDAAAAQQRSIEAGARGESVASARRNASTNIANADIDTNGQMSQLRATELAQAASGLGQIGTSVQGEDIGLNTTNAGLTETENAKNADAKNTAIQAAQTRYANGEITQAQLQEQISQADATFAQAAGVQNQNVAQQTAITGAQQELTAGLQRDTDLQSSLQLAATLQAQAAAGNQQAATQLTALQGTINAQISTFNATQIQTANASNITNRLQAMGLDDNYIANVRAAWVTAESNHDTTAIAALQANLTKDLAQAGQNAAWQSQMQSQFMHVAEMASGAAAPMPGADAAAPAAGMGAGSGGGAGFGGGIGGSDIRVKEKITPVDAPDVDAFLRSVGKSQTWQYKDPSMGEGRKLGPMAQDMAKDKLAASAVGETKDGTKTLDYQQLAALALAGLGRLNQRLEDVEGDKPKGKSGGRKPDVEGFLRSAGMG